MTTDLSTSLLANGHNTGSAPEFLRRNTHRFIAGFDFASYVFGDAMVLTGSYATTVGKIYFWGCFTGLMTSTLIMLVPERKNEADPKTGYSYVVDVLKRMVTPPLSRFESRDPRRFLACTNTAIHTFIYVSRIIADTSFAQIGLPLFALSVLCNSALAFPKKSETGYILYGAGMCAVNLGLLIANSVENTPATTMLACANAASLAMGVFAISVNSYAHRNPIKEAKGCGKVGALLTGDSSVVTV